ncbi:uncharacterized protein B4U79_02881, partial [Dinothrombium tinctorium]
TVRFHLEKYVEKFPKTCELLNDLYVDDFIGSVETVVAADKIKEESSQILKEAGMQLTKWQSNSEFLNEKWCTDKDETEITMPFINSPPISKVLGIKWIPKDDIFSFDVENLCEFIKCREETKRHVLQASARIFDPLGFISPFTIKIKILFQCLWEKGIEWDEKLPESELESWKAWCKQIPLLKDVKVERCLKITSNSVDKQIHIFCDASERAYGAVAYVRLRTDNNISITLLISKARVAPLKKVSLPRLELLAALIGARVKKFLSEQFNDFSFYLWSDSMVVLHWIKSSSKRWKPFVCNRVAEIQEKSDPEKWSYCRGEDNPADNLTRGLSVECLINNQNWWNGPVWLKLSRDKWPQTLLEKNANFYEEERKHIAVSEVIISKSFPLFDLRKYSSLKRILRVTAYILRFCHKSKKASTHKGFLITDELNGAEEYWIRCVQNEVFHDILRNLKNEDIDCSSKLSELKPFIDEKGIL